MEEDGKSLGKRVGGLLERFASPSQSVNSGRKEKP